jgi:hypothetical protein
MKLHKLFIIVLVFTMMFGVTITINAQPEKLSYTELKNNFASPDYSYWGEVPLWWWEADSLDEARVTWQLETLAAKGVKAVCPIQRSPARCWPESFSTAWWETLTYVHKECKRLGMRLWVYDQVGYGQYGWFEKAAAQIENTGTSKINFYSFDVSAGENVQIKIPEGELFNARAYPVLENSAGDKKSIDVGNFIKTDMLEWNPPKGDWKIAITTLTPYRSFYMNEASTDIFLDQLYQRIENNVGADAMGNSLIGVFQDEHPPTPRNIYTPELSKKFKQKTGYDLARAIPALHFDVGDKTPKYRLDYLDVYLSLVEETYWKKIYDWTVERNMLTSHDNWGRNNIYKHSKGYIDYFRTQRWYSAPGLDDWQQKPIEERNYYDTKIASSIARLYNRPRVWAEVFHTSGWGRSPNQTLTWLSTLYAFGANLYDEHGLYYSLNAGTWEHAAGDPHWRQPYWEYYQEISDWNARMSYILSQGQSVVDVAVHYPVVSVLAEFERDELNFNEYMNLSRTIYNAGIDNDIIDDESIINAVVKNGKIHINGNQYQALVFGAQHTIRLAVMHKAQELAESGGVVLFYDTLPTASVDNGRDDSTVAEILKKMLNTSSLQTTDFIEHKFKKGGYAAFVGENPQQLPYLLSKQINRDFIANSENVYMSHRKIGELDAYFIQNIQDKPLALSARLRADGVPEMWNAFTGEIEKVSDFERKDGYTHIKLTLDGNIGRLLVLKPGEQNKGENKNDSIYWIEKPISKDWQFSVEPTRNNMWGDFSWPPSKEKLGIEVRQFKYNEESDTPGEQLGWESANYDDKGWENTLYSTGPYWLALQNMPANAGVIQTILDKQKEIKAGDLVELNGQNMNWEELAFSKTISLAKPSPWGGHSGYPDGHFDKNFIHLEKGRKLLFTRIYSPQKQHAGLNVQLRNSDLQLWVNGKKEPFVGAVGNLPLKKGYNYILLDLPDGTGGKLYVQKDPPVIFDGDAENSDPTIPKLEIASWIWVGNTEGAYFRKSFDINELPESAKIVVTGVSGFRLFINGNKVEEDIGPWATWDYPKTVDIKSYLREGKNVFAAWGQFFKGIHVSYSDDYQGFLLALKTINADGSVFELESDDSWKGHLNEFEKWESLDFNDSDWDFATVKGKAGDNPWGAEYLKNLGGSTTPYRPLSVNLTSPYIQVFENMPNIVYDVKRESAKRVGWYRFDAPPGIKEFALDTENATVWVNGKKAPIKDGIVTIVEPPSGVSQVAVQAELKRGKYAGAAFDNPIRLKLYGGTIEPGLWSDFALPTYSGIGVYKQTINLDSQEAKQQIELDLGEVYVAAEVIVNGNLAGTKVAKPFKFNISQLVHPGKNEIEIKVANTLAPHYTIPKKARDVGPIESGLVGPVKLKISK